MADSAVLSKTLILVITLCLTSTTIMTIMRAWNRRRTCGFDDAVVGAATIVGVGASAAHILAIEAGIGLPWTQIVGYHDVAALNAATTAAIAAFTVALFLSKCAVISYLIRASQNHFLDFLYGASVVLVVFCGTGALLVVILNCPTGTGYIWDIHGNDDTCPSETFRWQVFAAVDILTEAFIFLLPLALLMHVDIPCRKKLIIMVGFTLRFPVIALSIVRTHYIAQLNIKTTDPGITSCIVAILMEVQLAYSIGTNTIPTMERFSRYFASGFALFMRDDVIASPRASTIRPNTRRANALPDVNATSAVEPNRHSVAPSVAPSVAATSIRRHSVVPTPVELMERGSPVYQNRALARIAERNLLNTGDLWAWHPTLMAQLAEQERIDEEEMIREQQIEQERADRQHARQRRASQQRLRQERKKQRPNLEQAEQQTSIQQTSDQQHAGPVKNHEQQDLDQKETGDQQHGVPLQTDDQHPISNGVQAQANGHHEGIDCEDWPLAESSSGSGCLR